MNVFGKLLTGAGIIAASIASANAADLPGNSEPPVYGNDAPADYDYGAPAIGWTGFYVGGHLGSASDDVETVGAYGVHTGFNWQNSHSYVMGIEGEITGLDADNVDAFSSVRGKLGYAFGKSLFYATAGVAFVKFENDIAGEDTFTGFAAGVGFDYKLTQSMSFGLDTSYYNFGDLDNRAIDDIDAVSVYGRLTFHLNGGDRGGYK